MNKLTIILIIGAVLVLSIFFSVNYFNIASTDGMFVSDDNIKVTNDKAEIKVELAGSAVYISGYSYYIEGDSIYVRIRIGTVIIPDETKLGEKNITIETDTSAINKIYLIGWDKTDTELIWERS